MSINRRRFLEVTALGAGAAAVGCSVGAPNSTPEATTPSSAVPAAIAALKPMTAGVVPISDDERKQRVAKAQELMAR